MTVGLGALATPALEVGDKPYALMAMGRTREGGPAEHSWSPVSREVLPGSD